MYYARELFIRKGPLGTIWLAGNFFTKVTRHQILSCSVSELANAVLKPPVVLALPTQSTLLRGVCRIENSQAKFLLDTAKEAKQALRIVDKTKLILTDRQRRARMDTITYSEADSALLPDEFLDYGNLEDLELFNELSQDRETIDLSLQHERYKAREALYTARPEDIQLTQPSAIDSQELSTFDISLPTYEADLESLGPGIDIEEMEYPAEMEIPTEIPSIAAEEAAAAAAAALPAVPSPAEVRAAARRRRRAARVKLIIDTQTELPDSLIRSQLTDTRDIQVPRPDPRGINIRGTLFAGDLNTAVSAIPACLQINPHLAINMSEEWKYLFESATTIIPAAPSAPVTAEAASEVGDAESIARGVDIESWAVEEAGADDLRMLELAGGDDLTSIAADIELEIEREGPVDTESIISVRSFLGRSLDESVLEQERRLSRDQLALEATFRRRRDSNIRISGEFATPELDVPSEEFELPQVEQLVSQQELQLAESRAVSALTEIFRNELESQLSAVEAEGIIIPPSVEFDEMLSNVLKTTPNRRDRSISFFQLLVLATLDVVNTEQFEPYGDLLIKRGPRWDLRLTGSESY